MEMYSRHNEGKSVVTTRFIRTSKNEIYKYMTTISKNMYVDKLDDIVNKEDNKEGSKFKVGDHVRILNYKNIFAKGYVPIWSEEVFVNKKS